MEKHYAVGVMSGTSLDGIDVAYCTFTKNDNKWSFSIEKAHTYVYSNEWKSKLKLAHKLPAAEFLKLHNDYGEYLGIMIKDFIRKIYTKVDIIASHGHTIFHQPEENFTFQLGEGTRIASITGLPTVSDFRTWDIALGGQGAPLVPVGDKYLFSDYDFCLNLGGFANISLDIEENRSAFDICPVNFVLNRLITEFGFDFDKNGEIGKKGKIDQSLLQELNALEFYHKIPPKSLSREWVEMNIYPLLMKYSVSLYDKLRTIYEHIAIQIYLTINNFKGENLFVTGGGAYNKFLIELFKKYLSQKIVIPENVIIDYKEALIFAFLGVLKIRKEINCFKSVTGAKSDSVVGVLHDPQE
ncbi:anhydro-N-acetylmuramic acid kinase [Bacteroidota bacterium]